MNTNLIHQLIQTAIEEENVWLDRDLSYSAHDDESVCLIGAVLAGLLGLSGVKSYQRRATTESIFDILVVELGMPLLALWHMEAGFEGWDMKNPSPAYKFGEELYNTYV